MKNGFLNWVQKSDMSEYIYLLLRWIKKLHLTLYSTFEYLFVVEIIIIISLNIYSKIRLTSMWRLLQCRAQCFIVVSHRSSYSSQSIQFTPIHFKFAWWVWVDRSEWSLLENIAKETILEICYSWIVDACKTSWSRELMEKIMCI